MSTELPAGEAFQTAATGDGDVVLTVQAEEIGELEVTMPPESAVWLATRLMAAANLAQAFR